MSLSSGEMRRSTSELFVHFVWTTYERYPWIAPSLEERLYASIRAEAIRCGAEVLAVGGMPDHVHLVLRKPPSISESTLMQRIKGVSSTFIRQQILTNGEPFHWQEHYGVFSFHKRHVAQVVAYVNNQKQHHGAQEVRAAWEESDEGAPE